MKYVHLILLITFALTVSAQGNGILRVEPAEVAKEVIVDNLDENFEDITSVVVTNDSRRTVQLVQETVAGRRPRAWSYSTSPNRNKRASPYVMNQAEQENGRPVILAPGESATYYVILRPDGMTGSGTVTLKFSDLTVPGSVLATSTVTSSITQRPATQEENTTNSAASEQPRPVPTTVRLYPNPAPERFFVESPLGTKIGRVEVANTLGRELRSFKGDGGEEGLDISELPDGLYLISIYDERGKKLKTLRLLHRRFGGA